MFITFHFLFGSVYEWLFKIVLFTCTVLGKSQHLQIETLCTKSCLSVDIKMHLQGKSGFHTQQLKTETVFEMCIMTNNYI